MIQVGCLFYDRKGTKRGWKIAPKSLETVSFPLDTKCQMPTKTTSGGTVFYVPPFIEKYIDKRRPHGGDPVLFERKGGQIIAWNYL